MTTQAEILREWFSGGAGDCQLPGFEALDLLGVDAMNFAQAQFAGDLRTLALGQWQWNSWLNSQGRVVALFVVMQLTPDHLRCLLPDQRAQALALQLRRFVFRSKVVIECPALAISGAIAAESAVVNRGGAIETGTDGRITIRLGGCLGRSLQIGADAGVAGATGAWNAADIADALPWLAGAAIEAWIPQALGLERLSAFSTSKGCYPGQEIVARTHFLGRNKRSLMHATVCGATVPEPGARLLATDDTASEAVAVVVRAAAIGEQVLALVVARDEATSKQCVSDSGKAVKLDSVV